MSALGGQHEPAITVALILIAGVQRRARWTRGRADPEGQEADGAGRD